MQKSFNYFWWAERCMIVNEEELAEERLFKRISLDKWNTLKGDLHILGRRPKFATGEIWWASFGDNMGVEINGKHEFYSRPVYIFKKLSSLGFLGVPLTSQNKTGSWYVPFYFNGRFENAILAQIKVMSVYRLYDRIGELDDKNIVRIKEGFQKLFLE